MVALGGVYGILTVFLDVKKSLFCGSAQAPRTSLPDEAKAKLHHRGHEVRRVNGFVQLVLWEDDID